MARKLYGASPADYFINPSDGTPLPGTVAQVFNAITGGSQVTDLQNSSGAAATTVTADQYGGFRFYGPDGYAGELWIQSPGGTLRYKAEPVDVASRLAVTEPLAAGAAADATTKANAAQAAAIAAAATDATTKANAAQAAAIATAATDASTKADAAEAGAVGYTDTEMTAHEGAANPHVQYGTFRSASTGAAITNHVTWVGASFPTAAQGAKDGDHLWYEG